MFQSKPKLFRQHRNKVYEEGSQYIEPAATNILMCHLQQILKQVYYDFCFALFLFCSLRNIYVFALLKYVNLATGQILCLILHWLNK